MSDSFRVALLGAPGAAIVEAKTAFSTTGTGKALLCLVAVPGSTFAQAASCQEPPSRTKEKLSAQGRAVKRATGFTLVCDCIACLGTLKVSTGTVSGGARRGESMKRQTGTHVIEIKTVGELISALRHVATDGAKLSGTWEVEWIADKVRLQMTYEMEAYEWSYT